MPTELPAWMREDPQQWEDQTGYHGISSSKDDTGLEIPSKPENSRDKRFLFNYFLTSTTVTTYSFATTIVTKAVAIASVAAGGAAGAAAAGPILCRPSGFVVC